VLIGRETLFATCTLAAAADGILSLA